jgi:hypothetical protein
VWDKKVAWAIQHQCYFKAMSRDEIVQALGKPTEEASYSLTYKRQTKDCTRYNGDVCSEYKTEDQIIFLKDGYEDNQLNGANGCRNLHGEHQYLGLGIPDFKLSKANAPEEKPPTAEEAASWHTKEYCEANGFAWNEESPTRCFLKKQPKTTVRREFVADKGIMSITRDVLDRD